MKLLPSVLLALSSLSVASTPVWGRSGEVFTFAYKAKELATQLGREALLQRMKASSSAACSGNQSKAYATTASCRTDLEHQFIEAMGNPVLAAEYKGGTVRIAKGGA